MTKVICPTVSLLQGHFSCSVLFHLWWWICQARDSPKTDVMLLQTPAPCFQLRVYVCVRHGWASYEWWTLYYQQISQWWRPPGLQSLNKNALLFLLKDQRPLVYLFCEFSELWSLLKQAANINQLGFFKTCVCVPKNRVSGCVCLLRAQTVGHCFWRRQGIFHTERCYIDCISPKPPLIRVAMIHLTAHLQFTQLQREPWSTLLSVVFTASFLLSFNYSICHAHNQSLLRVRALSYVHIQTLPSRCHGWTITFFISSKRSLRISKKDPSCERKSSWGYQ